MHPGGIEICTGILLHNYDKYPDPNKCFLETNLYNLHILRHKLQIHNMFIVGSGVHRVRINYCLAILLSPRSIKNRSHIHIFRSRYKCLPYNTICLVIWQSFPYNISMRGMSAAHILHSTSERPSLFILHILHYRLR